MARIMSEKGRENAYNVVNAMFVMYQKNRYDQN